MSNDSFIGMLLINYFFISFVLILLGKTGTVITSPEFLNDIIIILVVEIIFLMFAVLFYNYFKFGEKEALNNLQYLFFVNFYFLLFCFILKEVYYKETLVIIEQVLFFRFLYINIAVLLIIGFLYYIFYLLDLMILRKKNNVEIEKES
ncbi:MAG: hypothetical protein HeimC3_02620 [Candidatus Heimdallarchaeota archaeon LC_3]|nr:MAG: hypothetical protein HeimC3_02620 [Candidatus Heimdallarchaeota archaeon LC_3]